MRCTLLFAIFLACANTVAADGLPATAKHRDGRMTAGELSIAPSGAFRFQYRNKAVSLEGIEVFRNARHAMTPLRIPVPIQVHLSNQQSLLGEVIQLDETTVALRTAWADRMAIPRRAVERIAHPPGWRPIFVDAFERDLGKWKVLGKVERRAGAATSGKSSLVLDAQGQSAAFELPEPLAVGKLGVNCLIPNEVKGRAWHIELEFARTKAKPSNVRVEISGPGDSFTVQSPGKPEFEGRVRRTPGWKRLTVEWSQESLCIFADDLVLWSQSGGPDGELRACRLKCDSTERSRGDAGEVRFDDFAVHAATKSRSEIRPLLDAAQDAICSWDGDVLFGKLKSMDPVGMVLEGQFGKRTFPWTETQFVGARRTGVPGDSTDGEHVRITLRTNDNQRDVLVGAVKSLTSKQLVLQHSSLGEVPIPVDRIDEIRLNYFGKMIVVDSNPHHLGKRLRSGFLVPKAEGMTLSRAFKIDQLFETAALVVEACHLCGTSDGKEVAASLRRGGMQTAVIINDKRAGCLNDLVDRASPEPKRLQLTIPKGLLAIGDNVVEFRQTVDSETGQSAECELRSISLELYPRENRRGPPAR